MFLQLMLSIFVIILLMFRNTNERHGGYKIENHHLNNTMYVQSPWYEEIVSGRKTIEGRPGRIDKFKALINTTIILKNKQNSITAFVTDVKHYDTLAEYVDGSGWENIAPHANSRDDTIKLYHNIMDRDGNQVFSDKSIRQRGGMNAIYLST